MGEYFGRKETEVKPISTYDEVLTGRDKRGLKYLIQVLGDVSLEEDILRVFLSEFHTFGGRYDVRTDAETIKGMYEFIKEFPSLTTRGICEIYFRYIDDIFKECKLKEMLTKYISIFGETDEAFEQFILYVESKADEYEKMYKEEASKLDEFNQEYYMSDTNDTYQFINYLKRLVKFKHMSADKLIDSMPSPELIHEDMKQLHKLATGYRCYMGVGYPISYHMTESLAKGEDLSYYGDTPSYHINIGSTDKHEAATFTTDEFMESVELRKTQRN